ncbi:MAG: hypothetical protein IIA65_08785 [Planctomycetes bacterium]|nr:hypothetical protein [Planctomycetota bacterium]
MSAENLKRGQVGSQLLFASFILLLALAATPSGAQDGAKIDVQLQSVFNPFTLQRVDTSSKPVSAKPLAMSDGTALPALLVVKLAEANGSRPYSEFRSFKIRMPVFPRQRHRSPFRIFQ